MKPSLFLRYLELHHFQSLLSASKKFLAENLDILKDLLPRLCRVVEIEDELETFELKRVAIADFDDWNIDFFVVAMAEVAVITKN